LIIIGCVALICGYIRTLFLNVLAERQIRIIRQTLFQSILKKDIDYFDRHKTGELSTCLTDDVNKIQDGMGDKLGTAIEIVSILVSCLIIGKFFFVLEICGK
jgi:ABC-type multidrug transport system fused ATPase/permease subunit